MLDTASIFGLYRLAVAIHRMLDDHRRIAAIKWILLECNTDGKNVR